MVGKPTKKDRLKNENVFLRDLVNQLIYLAGATKYEMERLLDEGGTATVNTPIIQADYTQIMEMLGIDSIDPREAKKKAEKEEKGVDKEV